MNEIETNNLKSFEIAKLQWSDINFYNLLHPPSLSVSTRLSSFRRESRLPFRYWEPSQESCPRTRNAHVTDWGGYLTDFQFRSITGLFRKFRPITVLRGKILTNHRLLQKILTNHKLPWDIPTNHSPLLRIWKKYEEIWRNMEEKWRNMKEYVENMKENEEYEGICKKYEGNMKK